MVERLRHASIARDVYVMIECMLKLRLADDFAEFVTGELGKTVPLPDKIIQQLRRLERFGRVETEHEMSQSSSEAIIVKSFKSTCHQCGKQKPAALRYWHVGKHLVDTMCRKCWSRVGRGKRLGRPQHGQQPQQDSKPKQNSKPVRCSCCYKIKRSSSQWNTEHNLCVTCADAFIRYKERIDNEGVI